MRPLPSRPSRRPWLAAWALCVLGGACDPIALDGNREYDMGVVFPGTEPPGGPACRDGVLGGAETDIDCGGGRCTTCADGRSCAVNADCASLRCAAGVCISCADVLPNGDESDVDCGGVTCETRCQPGDRCLVDGDCTPGAVCLRGLCTLPARLDFGDPVFHPTGLGFAGLALGDVDGDRLLDVAATDPSRGVLVVLRGRGDGSFWHPLTIELGPGARPGDLAAGDLDGDGRDDLVAVDGGTVYVWRAGPAVAVGRPGLLDATQVALADFDGDGSLDIGLAGPTAAAFGVLHGDGRGGFSRPFELPLGPPGGSWLTAGDLDGDGCGDAVLAPLTGAISVVLGARDGTLRAGGRYRFPDGDNGLPLPNAAVAAGRFDGDARADVVAAQGHGRVQVLVADAGGGLTARRMARAALTLPRSAAVADFDGDGRADVALTAEERARIQILLGDGDGYLLPGTDRAAGQSVRLVRAGDMNRDGRPDLVAQAIDRGDNAVVVLLNATR